MADEMRRAVLVADKILSLHNTSRTRLWYPRFSCAWLGIAPPTVIGDDRVVSDDNGPECFEDERELSMAEAREGISELVRWREANTSTSMLRSTGSKSPSENSGLRLRNIVYGPRVVRLRLVLAACAQAIAHSSHLQHAIKNSIGVMLLSLPAFLPIGSPGGFRVIWEINRPHFCPKAKDGLLKRTGNG